MCEFGSKITLFSANGKEKALEKWEGA